MTEDEQIEFFFAPPVPAQPPGRQSTLYLLRRELQDCLIGEHLADERAPITMYARHRRGFATCLVLWAGIDLLAKFYAGEPDDKNVGKKFKTFVRDVVFMPLVERLQVEDEILDVGPDVLYQGLRNPMVHSFGLHSGRAVEVTLHLGRADYFFMRHPSVEFPNTYAVSLIGLYAAFLLSIQDYRQKVLSDPAIRANFLKAYPLIGSINVEHRDPATGALRPGP